MFEGGVCSEDGVVWLDNGGTHSWSGVDRELELGLLAVIGGESLKEKSTESGTGTTTEGVEDEETCIATSSQSRYPFLCCFDTSNAPWRPEQASASLRSRSRTVSMSSLPTLYEHTGQQLLQSQVYMEQRTYV